MSIARYYGVWYGTNTILEKKLCHLIIYSHLFIKLFECRYVSDTMLGIDVTLNKSKSLDTNSQGAYTLI